MLAIEESTSIARLSAVLRVSDNGTELTGMASLRAETCSASLAPRRAMSEFVGQAAVPAQNIIEYRRESRL